MVAIYRGERAPRETGETQSLIDIPRSFEDSLRRNAAHREHIRQLNQSDDDSLLTAGWAHERT